MLLLSISLSLTVGLSAIALQIYKGHAPVEIRAYLTTYSVILIPSMVFLIAAAIALNVLLRDKHHAYAVSFAIGGGLFYLFNQGYNHWLYTGCTGFGPFRFTGAQGIWRNYIQRLYCLAVRSIFFARTFLRAHIKKGLQQTVV